MRFDKFHSFEKRRSWGRGSLWNFRTGQSSLCLSFCRFWEGKSRFCWSILIIFGGMASQAFRNYGEIYCRSLRHIWHHQVQVAHLTFVSLCGVTFSGEKWRRRGNSRQRDLLRTGRGSATPRIPPPQGGAGDWLPLSAMPWWQISHRPRGRRTASLLLRTSTGLSA